MKSLITLKTGNALLSHHYVLNRGNSASSSAHIKNTNFSSLRLIVYIKGTLNRKTPVFVIIDRTDICYTNHFVI